MCSNLRTYVHAFVRACCLAPAAALLLRVVSLLFPLFPLFSFFSLSFLLAFRDIRRRSSSCLQLLLACLLVGKFFQEFHNTGDDAASADVLTSPVALGLTSEES